MMLLCMTNSLFTHACNLFTVCLFKQCSIWPAAGTEDAMQPVQALLEVAAYPDDGICAISYTFWHRLSRRLSSGFESQEDQQVCCGHVQAAAPPVAGCAKLCMHK